MIMMIMMIIMMYVIILMISAEVNPIYIWTYKDDEDGDDSDDDDDDYMLADDEGDRMVGGVIYIDCVTCINGLIYEYIQSASKKFHSDISSSNLIRRSN